MSLPHAPLSLRALGIALMAVAMVPPAAAQSPTNTRPVTMESMAGLYDGSQMEMAAALELRPDGRFRYVLAVGSLDEEAAGKWIVEDGRVLLTSDPVKAPRFVMVGQRAIAGDQVRVVLNGPKGMSRQYFSAELRYADGTTVEHRLDDENSPLPAMPGQAPVALVVELGMYHVRSEPLPLSGGGREVTYRFEANELGKVALDRAPLTREGNEVVLERPGGTMRFRRVKP